MLEEVFFKVQNYSLSHKEKSKMNEVIESLILQSPVNSQIELNIIKEQAYFKGSLQIVTKRRSFFVKTKTEDFNSLLKDLAKKSKGKLMKWKRSRRKGEVTGVINLKHLKELQKISYSSHKEKKVS